MEIIYIVYTGFLNILLAYFIFRQHRKTRKELQEVKTRQTFEKKRDAHTEYLLSNFAHPSSGTLKDLASEKGGTCGKNTKSR